MTEMDIVKKEIIRQIAHIMASCGHDPETLMYKLECLVLEWFEKGKRDSI